MKNVIETNDKGLFRMNGQGRWVSEYNMDCKARIGFYAIMKNGACIGIWIQGTLGHNVLGE